MCWLFSDTDWHLWSLRWFISKPCYPRSARFKPRVSFFKGETIFINAWLSSCQWSGGLWLLRGTDQEYVTVAFGMNSWYPTKRKYVFAVCKGIQDLYGYQELIKPMSHVFENDPWVQSSTNQCLLISLGNTWATRAFELRVWCGGWAGFLLKASCLSVCFLYGRTWVFQQVYFMFSYAEQQLQQVNKQTKTR